MYFHSIVVVGSLRNEKLLKEHVRNNVEMRILLSVYRLLVALRAVIDLGYIGTWNSCLQQYVLYHKELAQFQVQKTSADEFSR